jgi:hypothetical protein
MPSARACQCHHHHHCCSTAQHSTARNSAVQPASQPASTGPRRAAHFGTVYTWFTRHNLPSRSLFRLPSSAHHRDVFLFLPSSISPFSISQEKSPSHEFPRPNALSRSRRRPRRPSRPARVPLPLCFDTTFAYISSPPSLPLRAPPPPAPQRRQRTEPRPRPCRALRARMPTPAVALTCCEGPPRR